MTRLDHNNDFDDCTDHDNDQARCAPVWCPRGEPPGAGPRLCSDLVGQRTRCTPPPGMMRGDLMDGQLVSVETIIIFYYFIGRKFNGLAHLCQ